jgi:hypothetical protein
MHVFHLRDYLEHHERYAGEHGPQNYGFLSLCYSGRVLEDDAASLAEVGCRPSHHPEVDPRFTIDVRPTREICLRLQNSKVEFQVPCYADSTIGELKTIVSRQLGILPRDIIFTGNCRFEDSCSVDSCCKDSGGAKKVSLTVMPFLAVQVNVNSAEWKRFALPIGDRSAGGTVGEIAAMIQYEDAVRQGCKKIRAVQIFVRGRRLLDDRKLCAEMIETHVLDVKFGRPLQDFVTVRYRVARTGSKNVCPTSLSLPRSCRLYYLRYVIAREVLVPFQNVKLFDRERPITNLYHELRDIIDDVSIIDVRCDEISIVCHFRKRFRWEQKVALVVRLSDHVFHIKREVARIMGHDFNKIELFDGSRHLSSRFRLGEVGLDKESELKVLTFNIPFYDLILQNFHGSLYYQRFLETDKSNRLSDFFRDGSEVGFTHEREILDPPPLAETIPFTIPIDVTSPIVRHKRDLALQITFPRDLKRNHILAIQRGTTVADLFSTIRFQFPDLVGFRITYRDRELKELDRRPILESGCGLNWPYVVDELKVRGSLVRLTLGKSGNPPYRILVPEIPPDCKFSTLRQTIADYFQVLPSIVQITEEGRICADSERAKKTEFTVSLNTTRKFTLALCPWPYFAPAFTCQITANLEQTVIVNDIAALRTLPPGSAKIDGGHPLALLRENSTIRFHITPPKEHFELVIRTKSSPDGVPRKLPTETVRDVKLLLSADSPRLPGSFVLRFWDTDLDDSLVLASSGIPSGGAIELCDSITGAVAVSFADGRSVTYEYGDGDTVESLRQALRRQHGLDGAPLFGADDAELADGAIPQKIRAGNSAREFQFAIDGRGAVFVELPPDATIGGAIPFIAQAIRAPEEWVRLVPPPDLRLSTMEEAIPGAVVPRSLFSAPQFGREFALEFLPAQTFASVRSRVAQILEVSDPQQVTLLWEGRALRNAMPVEGVGKASTLVVHVRKHTRFSLLTLSMEVARRPMPQPPPEPEPELELEPEL